MRSNSYGFELAQEIESIIKRGGVLGAHAANSIGIIISDSHPIFNKEGHANIKVDLKQKLLINIFLYFNISNQSINFLDFI